MMIRMRIMMMMFKGLENIARKIHNATLLLAKGLRENGNVIENPVFFDTIKVMNEWRIV